MRTLPFQPPTGSAHKCMQQPGTESAQISLTSEELSTRQLGCETHAGSRKLGSRVARIMKTAELKAAGVQIQEAYRASAAAPRDSCMLVLGLEAAGGQNP